MDNNRKIMISTANSRKATYWKTESLYWSEFVEKLKTPARSTETLDEYLKLPKAQQDEKKDVGGFVAGELKNNKRKNSNILSRDLITLDLDNIEPGKTEDVLKRVSGLNVAYVVYSTRKHAAYKPRLRVIIPTARTMTPDEYEPAARKVASLIGLDLCDPTTFEVCRLMFWPSCSSDSEYIYVSADKLFLDVNKILYMYEDWKDVSEWPQVPGSEKIHARELKKQEDPTEKGGVIGAFCNSYSITEAVENFIPDQYEDCGKEDRLTYTGGSTFAGAVVYEDKFLYSHHATDPAGGMLCNAFDLVRLHLYGELDIDSKDLTPVNKLPSFLQMTEFARSLEPVSNILNMERYEKTTAMEDFADVVLDGEETEKPDLSWMNTLATNSNGNIEKTINNIVIILENDQKLKGKIALDEFANRGLVMGALPWNSETANREWEEVDDSNLRNYLEHKFKITGEKKVTDALMIVTKKNKINAVKQYLESLTWDGTKRLETLLIDYFGVEDNIYTRQVMKVSLTAAVFRAIDGAVKWDYTPILTGPQGAGKTSFFRMLGKEWFSNSLENFDGKEAAVTIQGTWINELGELSGMSKSELTSIKHFLTKQEDRYRDPYGRRNGNHPRRCVFFGTTNHWEFLKDRTGERRFWPVVIMVNKPKKSIFDELEAEVDQIWAEAYLNYKNGLRLELEGDEAKRIALDMQIQHSEANPREGVITEFLEREVTEDWNSRSLEDRKNLLNGDFGTGELKMVKRDKTCALEIWCECFGGDIRNMKRADAVEINSILESLPEWERIKKVSRIGPYGVQRGFKRITG